MCPERAKERIGKREVQCEPNADHRDRVEQARHDEHAHQQCRCELRLTRDAFEKAAAENAEADGSAECTQAKNQTDGEHSHGLDLCDKCDVFHSTLLIRYENECAQSVVFAMLACLR